MQYGSAHEVRGRLAEGTAPLAGQAIELRGRAYPYDGDFSTLATTVTDGAGAFGFDRKFDRNMQLQVVAPPQGAFSKVVRAYVFPRPKSTFKALAGGRLRITQILRTPANIKLSAKTNFYLGPKKAKSAARVATAKPKKIGDGPLQGHRGRQAPLRVEGQLPLRQLLPVLRGERARRPRRQLPQEVPLLGERPRDLGDHERRLVDRLQRGEPAQVVPVGAEPLLLAVVAVVGPGGGVGGVAVDLDGEASRQSASTRQGPTSALKETGCKPAWRTQWRSERSALERRSSTPSSSMRLRRAVRGRRGGGRAPARVAARSSGASRRPPGRRARRGVSPSTRARWTIVTSGVVTSRPSRRITS